MGPIPPLPQRLTGAGDLILRRWFADDAEALAAAVTDNLAHLRPWMGWTAREPMTLAARRAMLTGWERSWDAGGDAGFGVFLDGRIVGSCGLHDRIAPDGLELGYWIARDFTRRGLATEATRLLTDAALSMPQITHVEIHHDKANIASAGVPRRLGFAFVGEEPDEPEAPAEIGIECRWRMDREHWRRGVSRASRRGGPDGGDARGAARGP